MEKQWVDFRAVKDAVSMRMALDHYGVNWLRKRGGELRGRCPIHKGEGTDTFHANLSKNAFQCFSCKARGNVLDFVAAMEQCTIRDAAVKLAGLFLVRSDGSGRAAAPKTAVPKPCGGSLCGKAGIANKPLTFRLNIDALHPYLRERGIQTETADLFGVGFFTGRGSMSGRVVIPIENERGEVLAYAGRSVDGREPRYKLPAGFQKSLELFNVHRAVRDNQARSVVVVEGFFDCMKVYQAGYPCVALMGSSMSERQEDLLATQFRAAWLLFDGDDAGRAAGVECAARLAHRIFVKVVSLPDGKQPDMLTPDELKDLLG